MESAWLSTDERRLLTGYYRTIGQVGITTALEISKLTKLLSWRGYRIKKIPEYGELDPLPGRLSRLWKKCVFWQSETKQMVQSVNEYARNGRRIESANELLAHRELITFSKHLHDQDVICVALTLKGYDLGQKYNRWLEWSQVGAIYKLFPFLWKTLIVRL